MSGETEANVSAWTIDSVHSHLKDLMNERDRRYEQRFVAQEQAVSTANAAAEKRFDAVNEFRQQQADIVSNYMPRKETEQRIENNSLRITEITDLMRGEVLALRNELQDMKSQSKGKEQLIGVLVGVSGVVVAIVVAVVSRI